MICDAVKSECKTKPYFTFTFDIFISENKVAWEKMQLDGQFSWSAAAVEHPVHVGDIKLINL